MKFVYVVETGCRYEGGTVKAVLSSMDNAIALKPDAYTKEDDTESGFWYNNSDYFSITKMEIDVSTEIKYFDCSRCSQKNFEYEYYSSDIDDLDLSNEEYDVKFAKDKLLCQDCGERMDKVLG